MKVNRQELCILAEVLSISLLISSKTDLMSSKHGDKVFQSDSGIEVVHEYLASWVTWLATNDDGGFCRAC